MLKFMHRNVEIHRMAPRRTVLAAGLAIAASLIAAPSAPAASGPDLKTTVDASPNPVAAGQYVTASIGVTNVGDQTARNVVVKNFLPAATQFVPSDSRCSLVGNEVRCPIGDLVAGGNDNVEVILRLTNFSFGGTFQDFVTAHTSDTDADPSNDGSHANIKVYNNSHDHHVTVSKAEEFFSLPAGSGIQTFTLSCPRPGDIMTDGSVRVDNVDQGTGTLKDVSVLESYAEGDGYRFTLVNYAGGQAQGHLFGTCVPGTTEGANADNQGGWHTHSVRVGAPRTVTETFAAGEHRSVKVSCAPGTGEFVAVVAPGYDVYGAEGYLTSSMPGFDGAGKPAWDFGFTATQAGDVTFSIRCLDRNLSRYAGDDHDHELWLSRPDKTFTVAPNAPSAGTYDIDCSDEAKGIVAGWDFEDGLYMVGHDPQPKRRSFKLLNWSDGDRRARVVLFCLGDRSGTDPPPPVAPTDVAPVARASGSGAAVRVRLSCPASGCGGTVELVASPSGTRAVASARRVIGRGVFKATGKGRTTARVKIAKRYRAAVRSGKIRSVTAVVRRDDGRVAKRSPLRLK